MIVPEYKRSNREEQLRELMIQETTGIHTGILKDRTLEIEDMSPQILTGMSNKYNVQVLKLLF